MKLGDKLEVTDLQERLKLLIDGEVFYTSESWSILFSDRYLSKGESPFRVKSKNVSEPAELLTSLKQDWYYPAKTYKVGDTELTDTRVNSTNIHNYKSVFVIDLLESGLVVQHKSQDLRSARILLLANRDLIHSTKEGGVAHGEALLKCSSV